MTSSTSLASQASRNSSALPLPTNKAASGLERRPVSVTAGWAPALCASRLSSSRLASKSILPKSTPTSAALIKLRFFRFEAAGEYFLLISIRQPQRGLGRFSVRVEIHRTGGHDRGNG